MSEDLPYPDTTAATTEELPVTYDTLLADPNTPPGLVPHLQRLAAIDAGLAVLDPPKAEHRRTAVPPPDQLFTGSKNHLGVVRSDEELSKMKSLGDMATDLRERSEKMNEDPTFNYGTHWFDPDTKAREQLQRGDYTEQELASYIRGAKDMCDAYDTVAKARNEFSDGSRYEGVMAALSAVPLEKMRAVYQSNEHSHELREMLRSVKEVDDIRGALMFVQRMHGREDVLDLWEADSPAVNDTTFWELAGKESSYLAIASVLEVDTPKWHAGMDPAQETHNKRVWSERYLKHIAGLPEGMRRELHFDSMGRTSNLKTNMVDTELLKSMLLLSVYNARNLGPDAVTKLHEKAGITSIDYYSLEQLQLMNAVLDGNPAAIKHLKDGDVTVVFANTKGDYNGSIRVESPNFGTEMNRTLFFEIKQPGDIYRYMSMLKKHGIKPSTMVMAAHGNAGEVPINGGNGLSFINNTTGKRRFIDRLPGFRKRWERAQANNKYDTSQATGLARLLRDYMQDSRGIDDNEDAAGRRRLILHSCLSDAPVDVYRTSLKSKLHSIFTGMPLQESLAKTVAKTAANIKNRPNLDVYGNQEIFSPEKTSDGVRHYIEEENRFGKKRRRELPMTHYAMDRRGRIKSRRIESLPLRSITNPQVEQLLKEAA